MKPTQPIFDEFDVRLALIHACDAAGSQTEFAEQHHLSQGLISHVILGRCPIGKSILGILGFERVTRYIRKPAITSGESPHKQAELVP